MRLTVKERILLHLLPHGKSAEALEVPQAIMQEGIAEAAWIAHRHLSQYLRPLVDRGLVRERRAHVEGVRQRRKVYGLTNRGELAAARLRDKVIAASVRVLDENGERTMTVADALSEVTGTTPLEVVRLAMQGEPIRLEELGRSEESERIAMVSDAPRVEAFIGRKKEVSAITADEERPKLFVVRGIAGIGKSSLGAKVCEVLRGQRNLFWYRVRPWDTRDSVLSRIGGFLGALGKPGLREVMRRGETDKAPQVLREDLDGTHSFLVFDDVHEADSDVLPIFQILLESISQAKDVKAVVLTRHVLPFYSRRDVVLESLVGELELQGLDSAEVTSYLAQHGLPQEASEVAPELHGHPLFLELLRAHNPRRGALVDVHRYLEEEVYGDLPEEERGMMKAASLYRVPVPRESLFANPDWPHDVLLSLAERSLIRRVGEVHERFEVHDTIRDFFADLLTPKENESLGRFAVGRLRNLASEAREAEEFALSASYLSNALQLSEAVEEQAALWEALGDVNLRIGDLQAVSVAYRSAAKLAADAESAVRAHRKLALALLEWGDVRAADAEIQAGFEILGEKDSVERGWLHLARARSLEEAPEIDKGLKEAEAALDVFRGSKDQQGEAQALLRLARLTHYRGTRVEGRPPTMELLSDALDLADSLEDHQLAAMTRLNMGGTVDVDTGRAEDALMHFDAVEADPQAMKSVRIRMELLYRRAPMHGSLDTDFGARAADCRELIRLGRQVRDDSAVAYGYYLLAAVALVEGDVEEARRTWGDVAEEMRRLGNRRMYRSTMFHIGRCCVMQGDAEGFQRVRMILEESDAGGVGIGSFSYSRLFRALDWVVQGDGEAAKVYFEDILKEADALPRESIGSKLEEPRLHLIYGVVLRVLGDETSAAEHFRRSQELYEAGGWFGHQAEAEAVEPLMTDGLRRLVHASGL